MLAVPVFALSMLLAVFSFALDGAEKPIGSIHNVQLVQLQKLNCEGKYFGDDLFAVNNNDFPVLVSIKTTQLNNIKDGLFHEAFVLQPKERGYFGWLAQDKRDIEGAWNIEWFVTKIELDDTQQPAAQAVEPTPVAVIETPEEQPTELQQLEDPAAQQIAEESPQVDPTSPS
jgi:hypothetical protein